jgi:hypothetical protein
MIELPRSTFYSRSTAQSATPTDQRLVDLIADIHDEFPSYGYRRVTRELACRGYPVSRPCLSHNPFPAAAGSTQCPSAAQTQCQLALPGLASVCGPCTGDCAVLARAGSISDHNSSSMNYLGIASCQAKASAS